MNDYFIKILNNNKKEIENIHNIICNKLKKSVFNINSVSELILHLEMDSENLNKFKEFGSEPNPIFDKNSLCFINSKNESECLSFNIDFKKRKVSLYSIVLTNNSIKVMITEKETKFYFNKLISNYGYLSNFDFLSFTHNKSKIELDDNCDFSNMYFYCKEDILKKDRMYFLLDILRTYAEDDKIAVLEFLVCDKMLSKEFMDALLLKYDVNIREALDNVFLPDLNFKIDDIIINTNQHKKLKAKI